MYTKETGTSSSIVFYYNKQDLFDHVSLITSYRARNIKNQEGTPQVDDYAMSEDETDAFLLFAKSAVKDVYDVVIKLTKGISSQPVFVDETVTIGGSTVDNLYGFKIVDNNAYNDNVLFIVDDWVRRYIEYHILASWYELVGVDVEYKNWLAKRESTRYGLITKGLFQLRKPLISSPNP